MTAAQPQGWDQKPAYRRVHLIDNPPSDGIERAVALREGSDHGTRLLTPSLRFP
jgi:hypothetical protein